MGAEVPPPGESHPLAIEARWHAETLGASFIDTPLYMARAASAADFAAIWAILGSVMHQFAFPQHQGKFNKSASEGRLGEIVNRMKPDMSAWAGILFEQGSLATLEAFQTPHAQIRLLPGDLGFMIREMSVQHLCQKDPPLTSRNLPPINVHERESPSTRFPG